MAVVGAGARSAARVTSRGRCAFLQKLYQQEPPGAHHSRDLGRDEDESCASPSPLVCVRACACVRVGHVEQEVF